MPNWKVPGGQLKQVLCPTLSWYVPAEHPVHVAAPPLLKLPGEQAVQVAEPALLKLPALHSSQVPAPAAL